DKRNVESCVLPRLKDGTCFCLPDEDKNLCIVSRLIWFNHPRPPEVFRCSKIQISFKATGSEDEALETAPVRIGS
ncbi:hypothetical protein STEG23_025809, partial [Scotinomys teguina]